MFFKIQILYSKNKKVKLQFEINVFFLGTGCE